MLDQVTKKPFGALVFFLSLWVTNPSTIDNGVFGVRRDPNELCLRGNGHVGVDGGVSVTGTRHAIAVITVIVLNGCYWLC